MRYGRLFYNLMRDKVVRELVVQQGYSIADALSMYSTVSTDTIDETGIGVGLAPDPTASLGSDTTAGHSMALGGGSFITWLETNLPQILAIVAQVMAFIMTIMGGKVPPIPTPAPATPPATPTVPPAAPK